MSKGRIVAPRKEKRPAYEDVFLRRGLVLIDSKFDVPVFIVLRVGASRFVVPGIAPPPDPLYSL